MPGRLRNPRGVPCRVERRVVAAGFERRVVITGGEMRAGLEQTGRDLQTYVAGRFSSRMGPLRSDNCSTDVAVTDTVPRTGR